MEVNNFKIAVELFFDKLDTVNDREDLNYIDKVIFGRVIRRDKENPNKTTYIVKRYVFKSKEEFLHREEEIKELCELFNARFYISTNIKSLKDISFDMSLEMPSLIRHGNYSFSQRLFDSTADKNKGLREYQHWIVDIDDKEDLKDFTDKIIELGEFGNVNGFIPTVSGFHVLIRPHDSRYFYDTSQEPMSNGKKLYEIGEIKKNALTLIYYKGNENESK